MEFGINEKISEKQKILKNKMLYSRLLNIQYTPKFCAMCKCSFSYAFSMCILCVNIFSIVAVMVTSVYFGFGFSIQLSFIFHLHYTLRSASYLLCTAEWNEKKVSLPFDYVYCIYTTQHDVPNFRLKIDSRSKHSSSYGR